MVPPKLKAGDGVRIITPARSLALPWINKVTRDIAVQRFKDMGLVPSFGKHVMEMDEFNSSSVASRIEDIHDAFADPSIKLISTVIGGYSSNELLSSLDYDLIRRNPKALCGYSDITALANAIFAKTGLVTYSGPHFFNFGEQQNFEYTKEFFTKCLFESKPYEVKCSGRWSNDHWSGKQDERSYVDNAGSSVLNPGKAEGTIIGGNLFTFHNLAGTPYMPSMEDTVLFVEDDALETIYSLNARMTALTLNPGFSGVKGIVFGRFQPESKVSAKELLLIVRHNKALQKIPVIEGYDFGHTTPMMTFPIGGRARITEQGKMYITEH